MPHQAKIATCCYCGTRAALVLGRMARRELVCSNCGAPLRELKMLKADEPARPAPFRKIVTGYKGRGRRRDPNKRRKPKRQQSLSQLIMQELWEAADDIFDDVFDIFD
ncbi:MAG: hypothetical protein ACR2OY_07450 [Boseongicola sp.]